MHSPTNNKTTFKTQTFNPHFPEVPDILPEEVHETLGKFRLIDVRETHEYTGELGHIKEAHLMVLSTLPQHLENLKNSDETLIFVCRSGARSAQACEFLLRSGRNNVFNMKGGMLRWNQLRFPISTEAPKG